jgi:hypothetical protein
MILLIVVATRAWYCHIPLLYLSLEALVLVKCSIWGVGRGVGVIERIGEKARYFYGVMRRLW